VVRIGHQVSRQELPALHHLAIEPTHGAALPASAPAQAVPVAHRVMPAHEGALETETPCAGLVPMLVHRHRVPIPISNRLTLPSQYGRLPGLFIAGSDPWQPVSSQTPTPSRPHAITPARFNS